MRKAALMIANPAAKALRRIGAGATEPAAMAAAGRYHDDPLRLQHQDHARASGWRTSRSWPATQRRRRAAPAPDVPPVRNRRMQRADGAAPRDTLDVEGVIGLISSSVHRTVISANGAAASRRTKPAPTSSSHSAGVVVRAAAVRRVPEDVELHRRAFGELHAFADARHADLVRRAATPPSAPPPPRSSCAATS